MAGLAESKAAHSAGQCRKDKGEADPYPFRFPEKDSEGGYRADDKYEPIPTAVLGVFFVLRVTSRRSLTHEIRARPVNGSSTIWPSFRRAPQAASGTMRRRNEGASLLRGFNQRASAREISPTDHGALCRAAPTDHRLPPLARRVAAGGRNGARCPSAG